MLLPAAVPPSTVLSSLEPLQATEHKTNPRSEAVRIRVIEGASSKLTGS
jgi:hypothetical protein